MDAIPATLLSSGDPRELQTLHMRKDIPETEKTELVAREFERMMLRQVLKTSMKPMFGQNASTQSASSDIYQDLVTDALANSIGNGNTLSIAQQLQKPGTPPQDRNNSSKNP